MCSKQYLIQNIGVPPKYLNIITLLDFQTLQYILLFINDPVLSLMCQCTATEWKCRFTDALWYTASCQLRPGSCCGSYALPSRPCCTATSTIPARRSPTLLKMESSSLYSWSCSTTQTQTLSFRTTTVTAKWTDDVEHFIHVYVGSAGWYRRTKEEDGISFVCLVWFF